MSSYGYAAFIQLRQIVKEATSDAVKKTYEQLVNYLCTRYHPYYKEDDRAYKS